MTRTENTSYAILGILTLGEMSGYDIRRQLEESLIFFWSESYGQIYPALKRLAGEGLIAQAGAAGAGTRARHTFAITEKGRLRLARWLAEPPGHQRCRNEFLLKLFFGRSAPPGAICGHLRRHLAEERRVLETYEKIRAGIEAQHGGAIQPRGGRATDLDYWRAMLNHGIAMRQAEVAWCEQTLESLCAHEAPGT
jgi:DNA-binding PadR family transcriptional regulator